MNVMEEIRRINKEYPYTVGIKKWKEEGKKAIGWKSILYPG
jgi:hypothetical protein